MGGAASRQISHHGAHELSTCHGAHGRYGGSGKRVRSLVIVVIGGSAGVGNSTVMGVGNTSELDDRDEEYPLCQVGMD